MRFLIRVLIIFAVVMTAMSLLRGLFSPASTSPRRKAEASGRTGKLLKDPICGTYVTEEGSPSVTGRSEVFYFCSEECREKFLATGT